MKKSLAKRYIPSSVKWELVLKGVGKLYRAIYDELEKDDRGLTVKALADAAYRIGLDFGGDLKEYFDLGDTIEDLAFGMKSAIAEKSDRKVVFHCFDCAWQKYFTPKLCIAIGQAEKGIAHALNSRAKYHVLQTRTMGKDRCIFEVEV